MSPSRCPAGAVRRRRPWPGVLAAGLGAVLALKVPAGGEFPAPERSALDRDRLIFAPPARELDAERQVAQAQGLERAMRAASGRERLALRLASAEAWRALREQHPEAREEGAQGAWRAGRLLGALGFAEEARAEYRAAAELSPGALAWQARLELGHLERRVGRHEGALEQYLRVLADRRATAAARDEAMAWAGRAHQARGEHGEARRLWRELAERAADPVGRVRACDWLALDHLLCGDVEAAAGWVQRCRERLFEASLERTPEGQRVRRALVRMRAPAELALAADDRELEAVEGDFTWWLEGGVSCDDEG